MVEQKMFDSSSPHWFASERTELDRDVAELLSCFTHAFRSARIGRRKPGMVEGVSDSLPRHVAKWQIIN